MNIRHEFIHFGCSHSEIFNIINAMNDQNQVFQTAVYIIATSSWLLPNKYNTEIIQGQTHIHTYTYTDLHKLYILQLYVWKQACLIVFFFFRRDLSPAPLFICVFYLVFSIIIQVLPSKLPWCNPTVIPNIKEPHVSQTYIHTHTLQSLLQCLFG